MKRTNFQPKRVTMLSLILRAFAVAAVLILTFVFVFQEMVWQNVSRQCREQVSENLSRFQKYINEQEATNKSEHLLQDISAKMALNQIYDIILTDPLSAQNEQMRQIVPQYSPGCHAFAALVDEHNDIAASSRLTLQATIQFAKDDPDNGVYVCDNEALQLPEVDQLYADYQKLSRSGDGICYVDMRITSVYLDRKTHTFIPHEAVMQCYRAESIYEELLEEADKLETVPVQITIENAAYEQLEVYPGLSEYPRIFIANFYGESREDMAVFMDSLVFYPVNTSYSMGGYQGLEDGRKLFSGDTRIFIDGKPYWLNVRFLFNYKDPQLVGYFWKYTLLFAACVLFLAALWVWRRYVLNKAHYAFEDYQRDLTNHLAHDIKTPLMAIGGYAENLLDGNLSPEEQTRYLQSILENIAFTDSLVSRTLQLNRSVQQHKRETIPVHDLLEEIFKKYAPLLEEKHITYQVKGETSLHCDRTDLETILENLVSNAVKYTPEGGTVSAEVLSGRLTLTNTVAQKIRSVRELTRPFVRGDDARSNSQGTGLGLSLAEKAAHASGLRLRFTCSDTTFSVTVQ